MGDVVWTDEAREAVARALSAPDGVCSVCWKPEATQEQWDSLAEGERPDLCWESEVAHTVWDDDADARQAAHLFARLAPHVEAMLREARAEALVDLLADEQHRRCAYGTREGDGRTCDCKFDIGGRHTSEMTGCPELRQTIWMLRAEEVRRGE